MMQQQQRQQQQHFGMRGSLVGLSQLARSFAQENTSLTSLNISGHHLCLGAASYVAQLLQQHPQLTSLNLSNTGLTDSHLEVLCPAVPSCETLRSLNLSRAGPLGLKGARSLSAVLNSPLGGLQSLDLSFCPVVEDADESAAVWSVLAGGLACWARSKGKRGSAPSEAPGSNGGTGCATGTVGSPRSQVELLVASRANSSSAGGVSMGRHSCGGCRLKSLDISHCGLSDTGAESLAAALVSNAALTELNLAGYRAEAAHRVFGRLLESCIAAAVMQQQQQEGEEEELTSGAAAANPAKLSPAPSVTPAFRTPSTALKLGCRLRVLRVTGADYRIVNLLEDVDQQQQQQDLLLKQRQQEVQQQRKQHKIDPKQPLQHLGQLKRWVTKRRHQGVSGEDQQLSRSGLVHETAGGAGRGTVI